MTWVSLQAVAVTRERERLESVRHGVCVNPKKEESRESKKISQKRQVRVLVKIRCRDWPEKIFPAKILIFFDSDKDSAFKKDFEGVLIKEEEKKGKEGKEIVFFGSRWQLIQFCRRCRCAPVP